MSPSHAGPFQKSARSCHWCYFSCSGTMCSTMGVTALPKSKSNLPANCWGLFFVFVFCFVSFFSSCSPPTGFVSHFFAGLFFQPQILGLAITLGKSIFTKLLSGASVSCLTSYGQPFRTLGQRKNISPHLWDFTFYFSLFFSIAFLSLVSHSICLFCPPLFLSYLS